MHHKVMSYFKFGSAEVPRFERLVKISIDRLFRFFDITIYRRMPEFKILRYSKIEDKKAE